MASAGAMTGGPLFSIRLSPTYSAAYFYQVTGVTWVHGDGINAYSSVTVANTASETQSSTKAFKGCHRFNGGGTWPDVYLNGTQRAITSGAPPTTRQTIETGTTTGFAVGYNMSPVYWGGLISELIVTSTAIADADRQKIEAYQSIFFGF